MTTYAQRLGAYRMQPTYAPVNGHVRNKLSARQWRRLRKKDATQQAHAHKRYALAA
jgi:hypothetical protein